MNSFYKFQLLFILMLCAAVSLHAQTREELERQKQQLKKEIQKAEELLQANKKETSENFLQWKLVANKVALQDKVINNIDKDLKVLDNNAYKLQLDINRFNRILDTLKQEYAKSMVYAYKNRSNYDFLNFIFSADNFNDAIKRIAYLKSYRSYREMQGQNIVRTQELRKQKIGALTNAKQSKAVALQEQSLELTTLESQKQERDRILKELQRKGQSINSQIAAKQKQIKKVDAVIATAIKKALADARRVALAKSAEEERVRKEQARIVAKQRSDADAVAKRAEAARIAANKGSTTASPGITPVTKAAEPKIVAAPKPVAKEVKASSELLNSGNVALNANFERNRGALPWPVDKGYVLMHYGRNKLPSGSEYITPFTTIAAPIGSAVKSVFDGVVLMVQNIDGMDAIVIQHGKYFTSYYNVNGTSVSAGQQVRTGQVIGKVAANVDGIGAVDFYMANERSDFDPEVWLRNQ